MKNKNLLTREEIFIVYNTFQKIKSRSNDPLQHEVIDNVLIKIITENQDSISTDDFKKLINNLN